MCAAPVAVVVTSGERHEGKAGMVLLQVKLCDPCLSALCVPWCKKALYKILFLSFSFAPMGWLYKPLCETSTDRPRLNNRPHAGSTAMRPKTDIIEPEVVPFRRSFSADSRKCVFYDVGLYSQAVQSLRSDKKPFNEPTANSSCK